MQKFWKSFSLLIGLSCFFLSGFILQSVFHFGVIEMATLTKIKEHVGHHKAQCLLFAAFSVSLCAWVRNMQPFQKISQCHNVRKSFTGWLANMIMKCVVVFWGQKITLRFQGTFRSNYVVIAVGTLATAQQHARNHTDYDDSACHTFTMTYCVSKTG